MQAELIAGSNCQNATFQLNQLLKLLNMKCHVEEANMVCRQQMLKHQYILHPIASVSESLNIICSQNFGPIWRILPKGGRLIQFRG
ncbi:hypothetical protein HYC85_008456 [Camellia sinensis]|uniref:Uncharacterized protein n=1 Tax=Camellia sinensis TaxID=4442 RepID=A0A7J7HRV9_CAMSI|nr:hypothetical protein HYC85_008456 [Camellia sinensis]